MLSKMVALVLFQTIYMVSLSQVANDKIENRITLKLDEGYSSSTTNSNVEWDCINQTLTHKCLIYHNDQWFTIKPPHPGTYYLNVTKQNCHKLYGVQVVIIEGDPCKTDSYRLIKCIPFTDQSDFFLRLDSLDSNREYLVNIDGYLGDFCEFIITFGSSFQGIPKDVQNHKLNSRITQKDSIVILEWVIHDSLAFHFKEFDLFRKNKKEKAFRRLSIPWVLNAFGLAQKEYSVSDTLRQKGEYVYQAYGRTSDDMLLVLSEQITYPIRQIDPETKYIENYKRKIEYYVKKEGAVSVQVFDGISGKKLFFTKKKSIKGRNTITLDFTLLVKQGIFVFKVIIENKNDLQEYPVRFKTN